MPWHDNSGNGSGDVNKNDGPVRGPWGQPPNNGGSQGRPNGQRPRRPGNEPPDLEELLEASRQRLKRAFPRRGGGAGGGGGDFKLSAPIFGGAAVVLAIIYGLTGLYQVEAQQQAVVTTFGQYSTISGPGLHWHAPVIQAVDVVPVQAERTTTIPGSGQENLMLTSDRSIVNVTFQVNWKVKEVNDPGGLPNPAKYIFNIEDPEGTVRAVAEAAMRETIGGKELDGIITSGQAEIREQTLERIQQTLDTYDAGIEVIRVNLDRPEAPSSVREAFVDVVKARNDRERVINEAEREANQIIPVAQGEAQKMIQEAQAYAATTLAEAQGEAGRFNKIYEEFQKAPDVTRDRMYLETTEKILKDMNKIVVDQGAGSGVVPYLPLNELTRRQPRNN